MYIKTVRVTNNRNVLVHVPVFIIDKWGIEEGDGMEVHISDDEQSVIIKPRKGYVKVLAGSGSNEGREGLDELTERHFPL